MTWAGLALTLTLLGGIYTWFAFRRRGLAAGLRGAGLTLLPLAAYLTNTLRMFTRIVDAVVDWALSLVFSPTVWVGVCLAGLAVVLLVVARLVGRRGGRSASAPRAVRRSPDATAERPAVGRAAPPRSAPAVDTDDDMADIEALLRRRGIE